MKIQHFITKKTTFREYRFFSPLLIIPVLLLPPYLSCPFWKWQVTKLLHTLELNSSTSLHKLCTPCINLPLLAFIPSSDAWTFEGLIFPVSHWVVPLVLFWHTHFLHGRLVSEFNIALRKVAQSGFFLCNALTLCIQICLCVFTLPILS